MNVFVDGSYSPQYKIGIGAYVIIDNESLHKLSELSIAELKIALKPLIVRFDNVKGSTDVEQKILELALTKTANNVSPIVIYTDCQKTESSGNYIVNHIKGHSKQIDRIGPEKIFDVVDKIARKELRNQIKEKQR